MAPVLLNFVLQGCRERTDRFQPNPKAWSAFRSTDYGYSRMQILNSTHIYLEQVSDDQVSRLEVKCTFIVKVFTELMAELLLYVPAWQSD